MQNGHKSKINAEPDGANPHDDKFIFLSHASKDSKKINPLAQAIERMGWRIWWSPEISPGASWPEEVVKNLEAASCVLVVWTKRSSSSKWVNNEAREAEKFGKLVPALLEKCSIPLEFSSIEAANLTDWHGEIDHAEFKLLIKSIEKLIGPPPKIESTPPTSSVEQKKTSKGILVLKNTVEGTLGCLIWIVIVATSIHYCAPGAITKFRRELDGTYAESAEFVRDLIRSQAGKESERRSLVNARSLFENGDYREALTECDLLINNPETSDETKEKAKSLHAEIRNKMPPTSVDSKSDPPRVPNPTPKASR
jgi:TIR domain-containing protein